MRRDSQHEIPLTEDRGLSATPIAGLGPHGEKAAPPALLRLSEAEAAEARKRRFTVAVVLHTAKSDWAKQQIAGIVATLGRLSAAVVEVVDCAFNADLQIDALRRLSSEKVDAIISIPIGNTAVADAHRQVHLAGLKLILLDNVPTGLVPGTDYAAVVSADNFGLGETGAKLLAEYVPSQGKAGLLSYGIDFFATNEREIAFWKWMENHRPDIAIKQVKFPHVSRARAAADELIGAHPHLNGIFVVWDEPAMHAVAALKSRSALVPVITVDLGNEAAIEMAAGGLIKGIGAQQPYDQGVAVATAGLLSLLGRPLPAWIALPGLSVTRENVIEAYQVVWHAPAPPALTKARRQS